MREGGVPHIAPPVHLLHFMISDFRPPSVTQSGEATRQRLLANRAIGGHPLSLLRDR